MGGAWFDIPCTALKGTTAAAVELPPPPQRQQSTNPTHLTSSTEAANTLPGLADITTSALTPAQLRKLREFATQRHDQIQRGASLEEAYAYIRSATSWMHQQHLPTALLKALGQCIWRRSTNPTVDNLCALAITSFPRGEEFMWNALAAHQVHPGYAADQANSRYPNSRLPQRGQ